MQKIHVYKASAGSGKTFRLALEYLKFLLSEPNAHRHILAVSFTNKATGEMKQRILGELYGMAHRCQKSDLYCEEKQNLVLSDAMIVDNGIILDSRIKEFQQRL